MRVMQIIGSPKAGGAETFYLRLVAALSEKCEVLPVVRKNSWLAKQLEESGLPYETAAFGGALDVSTRRALARLARDFKPDVMQYWMNRAARFAPRVKAVKVARLGGYYNLKYYKKMDWLVANTHDICVYLRAHGQPEERVVYLPNFAAPAGEGYEENHEELRRQKRRELGLPQEAFVLLQAGRLHPNKGADLMLRALAHLPSVHLLLVGEGPQEKELRALAAQLRLTDRVHFLGWQENLDTLCASADLWVVPSRHEPLGNVILDAWEHRLPVVGMAAQGPMSLILPGKTGVLVPVEDYRALAEAIRELMLSPASRRKIVEAASLEVAENYARDVVVADYLDFYQRICGAETFNKEAA